MKVNSSEGEIEVDDLQYGIAVANIVHDLDVRWKTDRINRILKR